MMLPRYHATIPEAEGVVCTTTVLACSAAPGMVAHNLLHRHLFRSITTWLPATEQRHPYCIHTIYTDQQGRITAQYTHLQQVA